jgi:hypothetical protein
MPKAGVFEFEMATEKLKRCKSPATDQILAEQIKYVSRIIHPEIHGGIARAVERANSCTYIYIYIFIYLYIVIKQILVITVVLLYSIKICGRVN